MNNSVNNGISNQSMMAFHTSPARPRRPSAVSFAVSLSITSKCKIIGHFSMENHQFSWAIPHNLCIFNGEFKSKWAFRLQFASPAALSQPYDPAHHLPDPAPPRSQRMRLLVDATPRYASPAAQFAAPPIPPAHLGLKSTPHHPAAHQPTQLR